MANISGFGCAGSIIASNTFPLALYFTQFADEGTVIDIPQLTIADGKMALNGDLNTWTSPNRIECNITCIPASFTDVNFALLLEANRAGRGKIAANDVITLTLTFPQGNFITFQQGAIINGPTASSVQSIGRLSNKTYGFIFENRIGG